MPSRLFEVPSVVYLPRLPLVIMRKVCDMGAIRFRTTAQAAQIGLGWSSYKEVFMKLGPGLTFSWKRALGVTKAKRSIAKAIGIPTTKSGRRNKVGRWMGMK